MLIYYSQNFQLKSYHNYVIPQDKKSEGRYFQTTATFYYIYTPRQKRIVYSAVQIRREFAATIKNPNGEHVLGADPAGMDRVGSPPPPPPPLSLHHIVRMSTIINQPPPLHQYAMVYYMGSQPVNHLSCKFSGSVPDTCGSFFPGLQ